MPCDQEREQRVEAQLRGVAKENLQLRNEMGRLEGVNSNLQGYGLDNLSAEELGNLISSLTQVRHPPQSLSQMD